MVGRSNSVRVETDGSEISSFEYSVVEGNEAMLSFILGYDQLSPFAIAISREIPTCIAPLALF